ncbi:ATP phosphoribosyltransferase regulatory subunit [Vulcanimicrobium alpinum]|uniref:ATP phosphoribosyltransferase regulatory subunit n=1 Tax=Vulcanimicrobium alpinum TaxID=3016050 RepID=A0AAN2CA88_UNVUL|nr:ATP phosphoribosyltransferase regulatory subunit [Vulcanimicrobium alpinum]BDE06703.1 ATP phosphoribosyltransferase regulatory subunit [Vulcanimicrobium alpinum]
MRLPAGVRDWLPHELARKREIEQQMRAVFGRWAYEEVQSPIVERFDVLERGLGEETTELLFQFNDRRSTALALRPEMTTPIARMVSTRMREAPLPLRLAYVAPVFRYYEQPQEGRMRELTQAGTELIGAAGIDADAESLFMAIEALAEIGIVDARFDMNDARIVDGVVAAVGLDGDGAREAKHHIKQRNLVALHRFERPELLTFALRRGGVDAIEAVRPLCRTDASRAGLEAMSALLARAAALGYGDRVAVDFALLRDLDYYTGFQFEGYVEEIGFSLCGGGRYDSLLPKFGFDVPAVGWTAGVERLLIALERRGKHVQRRRHRIDVLVAGSDVVAARERAAGNVVRYAGSHLDDEALVAEARAYDIPRIVIAVNGAVRELRVGPRRAAELPELRTPSNWDAR